MSNKKAKKKAKKVEEPKDKRQTTGNDYYAEAEGVHTEQRGTTIIVNINAGAPPNPNPPPGGGKP